MKFIFLISLTLSLATTAVAKNRYAVIFKSSAGFEAMQDHLRRSKDSVDFKITNSLSHVNTIIVQSRSESFLETLRNHPEIVKVEAEYFTARPKPILGFKKGQQLPSSTVQKMNAVKWSQQFLAGDDRIPDYKAGASTPWGIEAVHAGAAWPASNAGLKARVLVLDTGIDAAHPELIINFEKGKNFFENDEGIIDPSDFKDIEGHGTHVSGTIAGAFNSDTGFTGVAPKAKLLMGRVCGTSGCSSIAVIEGINWGIEEKVDVISMSLGGPFGNPAEESAVTSADRAGIVVVAVSGNDGGPSVSFPAAFTTVIAVGAVDSTFKKTNFSQWGPELDVVAPGYAIISSVPQGSGRSSHVQISYGATSLRAVNSAAFSGAKMFANPIRNSLVYAGLGKSEDFAAMEVKDKFALIKRGDISFAEKIKNAKDHQAAGVIIFNNVAGLMQGVATADGSEIDIPVVMIEQSVGEEILQQLAQGAIVSGVVRTSSSDYAMFDGTSMAAPHVAGVVALIKSANKKLTPAEVRHILTSTSLPLGPNTDNEYGAGLIQADKAVAAALAL